MSNLPESAARCRDPSPQRAPSEIATNTSALTALLAGAKPGRVIAYHIGALARDRYRAISQLTEARRRELDALATYVLRLAHAGWMHLVQRRLGDERFLYLLIVRRQLPSHAPARISHAPLRLVSEAA